MHKIECFQIFLISKELSIFNRRSRIEPSIEHSIELYKPTKTGFIMTTKAVMEVDDSIVKIDPFVKRKLQISLIRNMFTNKLNRYKP